MIMEMDEGRGFTFPPSSFLFPREMKCLLVKTEEAREPGLDNDVPGGTKHKSFWT
jgi:hypothetical protein